MHKLPSRLGSVGQETIGKTVYFEYIGKREMSDYSEAHGLLNMCAALYPENEYRLICGDKVGTYNVVKMFRLE